MMFGQYLIMGSWAVTLSTFLMSVPTRGGLNFPAAHMGWIYSTIALGAIIAPLFTGFLADRLFAAEKVMGVLHLVGSVLLGAAAWWCFEQQPKIESAYRNAAAAELIDGVPVLEFEMPLLESEGQQRVLESLQRVNRAPEVTDAVDETFFPLFLLMFAYAFCNTTGITLSNVIAFRNIRDSQRAFGRVRLCGTFGWLVAGIQLELFWNTVSPTQLALASGASLVFGFYCLTLPHTAPTGTTKSIREALGLTALGIFRDPSIRVLMFCALAICGVQQFYGLYSNLFLKSLGTRYPAAVQTLAQVSEIICMALTPIALQRLGLKATLGLGLSAWMVRNSIFASGWLPGVVMFGLPLHGVSYAFFVMVASIYVDGKAPAEARASAQAIFTFATLGAGPLVGNWLSAHVMASRSVGDIVDWPSFWVWPASISGAVLCTYLLLFRETGESSLPSAPKQRT
jgi:nucleoside transporter